ncbi:MAG: PilC/PilY family type IV pilus protein [Desulfuromonadales bacterium]|nr:PilC/PilY family type IV pilus protein [Desulfuromonadales bacterium]MDW7756837.1 PilC/PilY family type IV pilus protein [Desulfuromonadales bacterium]
MKRMVLLLSGLLLLLGSVGSLADDSCIFAITADDVPPNVVLLLDNGAEMEKILTHSAYDPSVDWTPNEILPEEGVNGFYNPYGYTIYTTGNKHYIHKINSSLLRDTTGGIVATTSATADGVWSIGGKIATLPAVPSAVVDAAGIKDNATRFRYDTNYLNWIFFGPYNSATDGTLPNKSNFYQAKQALMQVAKKTANQASFGIYAFTSNASGASNVQPLGLVVQTPLTALPENNVLDSAFVNNINNMGTVTYSPLAEGLQSIGTYYGSPSSGVVGYYCQKNFVIVVTPGVSSEDLAAEATWADSQLSNNDYDGDRETSTLTLTGAGANAYSIPLNLNGTTHLDDLAQSLYANDVVDYQAGFQNIMTYTVGLGKNPAAQAFLINTSNNGNGNTNLYDTDDPDYGKFHFQAADPSELADRLEDALKSILENTATFTAPVVPVTRTSSGDYIYLSFFKPLDDSNFWQGDIAKFALGPDNEIIDMNGNPATEPNGAMKPTAVPYWSTLKWASSTEPNYMPNADRNIYTYQEDVGTNLTWSGNAFTATNISPEDLGYLSGETDKASQLVNYIRGADAYADNLADRLNNRSLITGDALHSEPAVFSYTYLDSGGNPDTENTITRVFYGANDGMLHVVDDADGTEAWAFVPPDLLGSLKWMVEGVGHQIYVDASPKIYFHDVNNDGYIDRSTDQVILVFGERRGGTSYWALDVTDPDYPTVLWTINPGLAEFSELGESWSEPEFGKVKYGDPEETRHVLFIGGGYSEINTQGRAIYIVDVLTGQKLKEFSVAAGTATGMTASIPSSLTLIDANDNGFVDKAYVGDMGGNIWRLGRFTDSDGNPFGFYTVNENVSSWSAQALFNANTLGTDRKFFYPPDVALEWGYDVVFTGSGNREEACSLVSSDRIFAIKDNHQFVNLTEADLVNASLFTPIFDSAVSDVDGNGTVDKGWYYPLATGEKVLAQGVVFYKVFFITTFAPNTEPCVPGGYAYLYGLGYKTGFSALDSPDDALLLGGGIASRPVVVIRDKTNMLISVGSTNPIADTDETGAGVMGITPDSPPKNLFIRWWRELFE